MLSWFNPCQQLQTTQLTPPPAGSGRESEGKSWKNTQGLRQWQFNRKSKNHTRKMKPGINLLLQVGMQIFRHLSDKTDSSPAKTRTDAWLCQRYLLLLNCFPYHVYNFLVLHLLAFEDRGMGHQLWYLHSEKVSDKS